jgi:hypothetical protein
VPDTGLAFLSLLQFVAIANHILFRLPDAKVVLQYLNFLLAKGRFPTVTHWPLICNSIAIRAMVVL